MRTSAEASRRLIRRAALATFCERGYCATTLEEIGLQAGITRGAVLHHFKSKPALLRATVEPYLEAVADLFAAAAVSDPPTTSEQRGLLTALTDLLLEHRFEVQLLATDVAARVQLGLVGVWGAPSHTFVALLLGSQNSQVGQLRVSAALGAIIQPLASGGLELDPPWTRDELIDAALAVLGRPNDPPLTIPELPAIAAGETCLLDHAVAK